MSKILSDKKLCPTKFLSKKVCVFRLFYWTKVTKFVKEANIVLSDKVFIYNVEVIT